MASFALEFTLVRFVRLKMMMPCTMFARNFVRNYTSFRVSGRTVEYFLKLWLRELTYSA